MSDDSYLHYDDEAFRALFLSGLKQVVDAEIQRTEEKKRQEDIFCHQSKTNRADLNRPGGAGM